MTNLDSILKTKGIILSTKVHMVKATVFLVVMYGCESWTIKKAERQRIDEELTLSNCGAGEDGRRQWHPTPVLLPGKSHGWRSLVGSSPWGREESGMTERLHFHFLLSCTGEGNGNPLQCSCLENTRDRGDWWAAVYGVAQSRTRLKRLSSSSSAGFLLLLGFSVVGVSRGDSLVTVHRFSIAVAFLVAEMGSRCTGFSH